MEPEQTEQLKSCLLSVFSSASELNGWLCLHVWPAFKQNAAAQRAKQKNKKHKDDSPISTRFKAFDGSPMTEDQVGKAASNGAHVLELATGQPRRFLWRIKGKVGRWVPLDYKGSF